jgi:hypothetical protein
MKERMRWRLRNERGIGRQGDSVLDEVSNGFQFFLINNKYIGKITLTTPPLFLLKAASNQL